MHLFCNKKNKCRKNTYIDCERGVRGSGKLWYGRDVEVTSDEPVGIVKDGRVSWELEHWRVVVHIQNGQVDICVLSRWEN